MSGRAIDFTHLETYVGGDLGIAREVLSLFCEQARTVLPAMDPAGPADDWRNVAHSLKGSALGIGAFALAEACGEAETAKEATLDQKKAARSRIADRLGEALADIHVYMAG